MTQIYPPVSYIGNLLPQIDPTHAAQRVSAGLAGGEVEVAGVDRAAADDALDAFLLDRTQRLDVLDVGQAAAQHYHVRVEDVDH